MSAIANIAITDAETTPVTHTFYPVQSAPDAFYRERITDLALVGQGTVRTAMKPDKGSGLNKVTVTLELPALEALSGNNSAGYTAMPKVGYSNKVIVTFFLPSRGSKQQRKNLLALLSGVIGNQPVLDLVWDLSPPY